MSDTVDFTVAMKFIKEVLKMITQSNSRFTLNQESYSEVEGRHFKMVSCKINAPESFSMYIRDF